MQKRYIVQYIFVVFICIFSCLAFCGNTTLFEMGDYYVFYINSASSSAEIVTVTENVNYTKLTLKNLSGESTFYTDFYDAESLIEKYNGEIIKIETVGEITNYYLYSAKFNNDIILFKNKVNLHIAVTKNGTAIGSPIIFGGY